MKRRQVQAFEPIPELLRPQNCAGYLPRSAKPAGSVVNESPCPEPAAWFSTATGSPLCDAHKEQLERIQRDREITPP